MLSLLLLMKELWTVTINATLEVNHSDIISNTTYWITYYLLFSIIAAILLIFSQY